MNLLDYGISVEQAQNFDKQGNLKPVALPEKKDPYAISLDLSGIQPEAKWDLSGRPKDTNSTSKVDIDELAYAMRNASFTDNTNGLQGLAPLFSGDAAKKEAALKQTRVLARFAKLKEAGIDAWYNPVDEKYEVDMGDGTIRSVEPEKFEGDWYSTLKDNSMSIALGIAGGITVGAAAAAAPVTGGTSLVAAASLLGGGIGAAGGSWFDLRRNADESILNYTDKDGKRLQTKLAREMSSVEEVQWLWNEFVQDVTFGGVLGAVSKSAAKVGRAILDVPGVKPTLMAPLKVANWATKPTTMKAGAVGTTVGGIVGAATGSVVAGGAASLITGYIVRNMLKETGDVAVAMGVKEAEKGIVDTIQGIFNKVTPRGVAAHVLNESDLDALSKSIGIQQIDPQKLAAMTDVFRLMLDSSITSNHKILQMSSALLASAGSTNILKLGVKGGPAFQANVKESLKYLQDFGKIQVDVADIVANMSSLKQLAEVAHRNAVEEVASDFGAFRNAPFKFTSTPEDQSLLAQLGNFATNRGGQYVSLGTVGSKKSAAAYKKLNKNETGRLLRDITAAYKDITVAAARGNYDNIKHSVAANWAKEEYSIDDILSTYLEASVRGDATLVQAIKNALSVRAMNYSNAFLGELPENATANWVRQAVGEKLAKAFSDLDTMAVGLRAAYVENDVLGKAAIANGAKDTVALQDALRKALTVNAGNPNIVNNFLDIMRAHSLDDVAVEQMEQFAVQQAIADAFIKTETSAAYGLVNPNKVYDALKDIKLTSPFAKGVRDLAYKLYSAVPKYEEVLKTDFTKSRAGELPVQKGVGPTSWASKAKMWMQNYSIDTLRYVLGRSNAVKTDRVFKILGDAMLDPSNAKIRQNLEKEFQALVKENPNNPMVKQSIDEVSEVLTKQAQDQSSMADVANTQQDKPVPQSQVIDIKDDGLGVKQASEEQNNNIADSLSDYYAKINKGDMTITTAANGAANARQQLIDALLPKLGSANIIMKQTANTALDKETIIKAVAKNIGEELPDDELGLLLKRVNELEKNGGELIQQDIAELWEQWNTISSFPVAVDKTAKELMTAENAHLFTPASYGYARGTLQGIYTAAARDLDSLVKSGAVSAEDLPATIVNKARELKAGNDTAQGISEASLETAEDIAVELANKNSAIQKALKQREAGKELSPEQERLLKVYDRYADSYKLRNNTDNAPRSLPGVQTKELTYSISEEKLYNKIADILNKRTGANITKPYNEAVRDAEAIALREAEEREQQQLVDNVLVDGKEVGMNNGVGTYMSKRTTPNGPLEDNRFSDKAANKLLADNKANEATPEDLTLSKDEALVSRTYAIDDELGVKDGTTLKWMEKYGEDAIEALAKRGASEESLRDLLSVLKGTKEQAIVKKVATPKVQGALAGINEVRKAAGIEELTEEDVINYIKTIRGGCK